MRLLYFGDGFWAANALTMLIEQGYDIPAVVIRMLPTDDSLEMCARKNNIPVLQHMDVNSEDFLARIAEFHADLNASVSFDQILREAIRTSAPEGFINFHAGKLPDYRGRNVLNWTLINGESEIGITGHYVDDGVDTGDIILQRTLPVGENETYGELLKRVTGAFPALVTDTIALIAEKKVERRKQSHLLGATFSRREEGDEWIDWSRSSRYIHNLIRGITRPGPGARTLWKGKVATIWAAEYNPSWPCYEATPGQVVRREHGRGVYVKTGDSLILLTESQVEGNPAKEPAWRVGTRLGLNLQQTIVTLLHRIEELENNR